MFQKWRVLLENDAAGRGTDEQTDGQTPAVLLAGVLEDQPRLAGPNLGQEAWGPGGQGWAPHLFAG